MSNPEKEENKNENENEEEEEESEEEEEKEEIVLRTIPIKTEKLKSISLDIETYNKLINFLNKLIEENNKLTKLIKNVKPTKNTENTINSINIKSETKSKETQTETETIKKETETTFKPNGNIQQSYEKLLEEYEKIKTEKEEIETKKKEKEEKYEKSFAAFLNDIMRLKAELKQKEAEIEQMKFLIPPNKNNTFDTIKNKPKLIQNISSYLTPSEQVDLSKTCRLLWLSVFYKTKIDLIQKQLNNKQTVINSITQEDVTKRFEISEDTLKNLIVEYIINNKIPGSIFKNEIIKSLLFLEKTVKTPMNNFLAPKEEKEPKINNLLSSAFGLGKGKKDKLLGKISGVFSLIKGNDETEETENKETNLIQFKDEEYKNIPAADLHILNCFMKNNNMLVKFEYNTVEEIKELISKFFNSHLPKVAYQNYISKISETFADLLFSCYLVLKEIRDIEIIMHMLYCRFMKYKEKCGEYEIQVHDLSNYTQNFKQIKEMLLKQKNEVEMKYNNSLMQIAQITNEKNDIKKQADLIKDEMEKNKKQYEGFKNQIVKEYKAIQNDLNLVKKERELLKGTLLDFRDYVLKHIGNDGELIG